MLGKIFLEAAHENKSKPILVTRNIAWMGVRFSFLGKARGHQLYSLGDALSRNGILPFADGRASPLSQGKPDSDPHPFSFIHGFSPPRTADRLLLHRDDHLPHGRFCAHFPRRQLDSLPHLRLPLWILDSLCKYDRASDWVDRAIAVRVKLLLLGVGPT